MNHTRAHGALPAGSECTALHIREHSKNLKHQRSNYKRKVRPFFIHKELKRET